MTATVSSAGEVSSAAALPVLARLKLTLLVRHFQRQPANAVVIALILLVLGALGLVGVVVLYIAVSNEQVSRDSAMLWTAWIFSVVWLTLPLTQFDVQRNLDLSGLRLLPLSSRSFTLAAVLDSVLSPMGLLLLPLLLLTIPALTRSLAELPLVLVAYALLLVTNLALGQALFMSVSRLLSNRRFADISMIAGVLFIFLFQGVNLLFSTGGEMGAPTWLGQVFIALREFFAPLGIWLYPGLASGSVSAAASGDATGAALRTALLLAQAGIAVLLALRAVRAFYEGEVESSGSAKRRFRQREGGGLVGGALGALFHRERIYLLRDPLLKALFLQTLMGVAYMSLVTVFLVARPSQRAELLGGDSGTFILLGLALMLSYSESYLLFNKLGLEGALLTHTLLSPVSRRTLLAGKSLFLQAHFMALNTVAVLGLGLGLGARPLFIAAAVLMLAANSLIIDVVGHFVSVYFPFSYRRQGRQLKAVYAQTGCGYMLLYGIVTQLANLVVLPLAAAIALGAYFGGAPGLLGGATFAGLAVWAAYAFGLPHAANVLQQREPEVISALTPKPD